jgi:hypothetical protein
MDQIGKEDEVELEVVRSKQLILVEIINYGNRRIV